MYYRIYLEIFSIVKITNLIQCSVNIQKFSLFKSGMFQNRPRPFLVVVSFLNHSVTGSESNLSQAKKRFDA